VNQPLPQAFVDAVEGYIRRNMPGKAADECVRMVQTQPISKDLLVYCGKIVFFGTTDHIQQLLAAVDSYLATDTADAEVRELRAVLLGMLRRYPESLAEYDQLPDDHRHLNAPIVAVLRSIVNPPECSAAEVRTATSP